MTSQITSKFEAPDRRAKAIEGDVPNLWFSSGNNSYVFEI